VICSVNPVYYFRDIGIKFADGEDFVGSFPGGLDRRLNIASRLT
jgi:hypothetical protein